MKARPENRSFPRLLTGVSVNDPKSSLPLAPKDPAPITLRLKVEQVSACEVALPLKFN
jgi:hypothetical protein